MSEALLDGLTVLDMSQFLSGPFAALRLGDLGARVIKIERPDGGDLCRRLYLTDTEIGGDSTLFHAINRGKLGFAADFKNPADVAAVKTLIAKADVVVQNFRPGVIERLGLDYAIGENDQSGNRLRLDHGLWRGRSLGDVARPGPAGAGPHGDYVAERRSRSGPGSLRACHRGSPGGERDRSGRARGAARRARTGEGAHIETSLLEALVDFQFEVLTTYINDGGRIPRARSFRNAHAYLAAALRRLSDPRRLDCDRDDAARQARESDRFAGDRRAARRVRRSSGATRSSAPSPVILGTRRPPRGSPACSRSTSGAPKFWTGLRSLRAKPSGASTCSRL